MREKGEEKKKPGWQGEKEREEATGNKIERNETRALAKETDGSR